MDAQDKLREQIIKQFEADAIVLTDQSGNEFYACPTCKRQVAMSNNKCGLCGQSLKWDNVRHIEAAKSGIKTATLTFEVPGNFSKSDCRKCPLSYISRREGKSAYECPLNLRNNCPLEIQ